MEKRNAQIARSIRVRLGLHDVGTGHAGCAGSRAGHDDHAGRLRLRNRQDASEWHLCGQNHEAPAAEVRAVAPGQLHSPHLAGDPIGRSKRG